MKIKILFLDSNISFMGGGSLSLLRHFDYIDKSKFDIFLGHSQYDKLDDLELFVEKGARCYSVFDKKLKTWNIFLVIWRLLLAIRRIGVIVRNNEIDIIVGNSVRGCILATVSTFFSRVRSVWIIREYEFPKIIFNFLTVFTDRRLYISHGLLNSFSFKNKHKDILVNNGTDFYKKLDIVKSEDVLVQRKNWGDPSFAIGYVGRLVAYKGVIVLLQAFKALKDSNHGDIKLIIVGSGKGQVNSSEQELRDYVESNGLSDSVIFMGARKDVPLLLSSFDVCCFPNILPEGFGVTLIEAMMAGVPTIVSDLPELNIIIDKLSLGTVVEPSNPEALSCALIDIMNNKGRYDTIAEAAKRHSLEYYTFNIVNKKMETVYKELINNHKK